MPLTVVCPGCKTTFPDMDDALAARKIRCRTCTSIFAVAKYVTESTEPVHAPAAPTVTLAPAPVPPPPRRGAHSFSFGPAPSSAQAEADSEDIFEGPVQTVPTTSGPSPSMVQKGGGPPSAPRSMTQKSATPRPPAQPATPAPRSSTTVRPPAVVRNELPAVPPPSRIMPPPKPPTKEDFLELEADLEEEDVEEAEVVAEGEAVEVDEDDEDYEDEERPKADPRAPGTARRRALVVGLVAAVVLFGLGCTGLLAFFSLGGESEQAVVPPTRPRTTGVTPTDASRTGPAITTAAPTVAVPTGTTPAAPTGPVPNTSSQMTNVPKPIERPGGGLDPVAVERLKRAAAVVQVVKPDNSVVTGGGFLSTAPGRVITHPQALGMADARDEVPKSVGVVFNSGQPDEERVPGRVLGVSWEAGVAVIGLAGGRLPDPLPLGPASGLTETQTVYVVGPPPGAPAGSELTLRKASVAGLRRGPGGAVTRLQLDGGERMGATGSPLVSVAGEVVGVVGPASAMGGLSLCVPGEEIISAIRGRPLPPEFGVAARAGGELHVPIRVALIDPLRRINRVTFTAWAGQPDPPERPGGAQPPPPAPGDKAARVTPLSVTNELVGGEVRVPTAQPDEVVWWRLSWESDGEPYFGDAALYNPGDGPVDPRPVRLVYKPLPGSATRRGELLCNATLAPTQPGAAGEVALRLTAKFTEVGRVFAPGTSPPPGSVAASKVTFTEYDAALKVNGESVPPVPGVALSSAVKAAHFESRYAVSGDLAGVQKDTSLVAGGSRQAAGDSGEQALRLLAALAPPLTGRVLTPGDVLSAARPVPLGLPGRSQSPAAGMRYTYRGARERDGRSEAVFTAEGEFTGPQGGPAGRAFGTVAVDPESGAVSDARVNYDLEHQLDVPGWPGRARGNFQVSFRRPR